MRNVTKAVLLFLAYLLISILLTDLVLYVFQLISNDSGPKFPFPGFAFLFGSYLIFEHDIPNLLGFLFLIYYLIKRLLRRQRPSSTLNLVFVLSLILSPLLISWLIIGHVHPSGVLQSFLVCIQTVLAIVMVRITIGRSFKDNHKEPG